MPAARPPLRSDVLIDSTDRVLVTGAAGFIGVRVVENLVERGFRRLRCFVRPSSETTGLEAIARRRPGVEIVRGNLLSRSDCMRAAEGAAVVYHLAAAKGEKSFSDSFLNSVVTTRNLLDATLHHRCLRRFVHVSSFAVYANTGRRRRRLLDETSPVEPHPARRGEAYCFAKVKQEELLSEYGATLGVPYVIVRPGYVYGPGQHDISGRVGISTFGLFLHLGGANTIPLTYVDNCADAIVLAGLRRDVAGEVFNVVDDDLPSSRTFLRLYKRNVRPFASIYVPHALSHALCWLWEAYAAWSEGQLPPVFNRRRWHANWRKTRYTNARAKARLGWMPRVPTAEGLERYFQSCRRGGADA